MATRRRRTIFSEDEETKFQRFWDLAEADDADIEPEEQFDLYDQYFTTPREARAYGDWCKANNMRRPKKPAAAAPAEPVKIVPHPLGVYQSQLQNADFTDVDRYTKGDKNFAFRLVPSTRVLRTHKEMHWEHNSNKVVLPEMVLGINHNVRNEPKVYDEEYAAIRRYLQDPDPHSSDDEEFDFAPVSLENYVRLARKVATFHAPGKPYGKYGEPEPTNLSPGDAPTHAQDQVPAGGSTKTGGATTLNDVMGFAFYQLGVLHKCSSLADPTTTNTEEIFACDWFRTDYVLVAEIDGLGRLGDIWVLWNFYGDPSEDDPFVWVRQGSFPGTEDYISAAKIADSFADLKADREIRFEPLSGERFEEDFELVGCFRLPHGPIVRQWVLEPSE